MYQNRIVNMLKNFWWPLEFAHVVKDKPIRVTALEQEFVLYRTPDGSAHVLSDLCVHRGEPSPMAG